jgi:hypothetical protein
MALASFDPPAGLPDFNPALRAAWDTYISYTFDQNIQALVSVGLNPQFYNPTKIDTPDNRAADEITWIGFPRLISLKHPNDDRAAWQEADTPSHSGERPQDEYLEWFVERTGNKVLRVTFTCEGPEYWEALAHGYPLDYNGPRDPAVKGDTATLLALYRQHIDPGVQLNDLFSAGKYNRLNKWNASHGAMHLNQRNNTLGAEINIAAQATVLRADKTGQLITDADALIQCAQFGQAGRASDPTIGDHVNSLARDGYMITLQNPVGLYMAGINTAGFVTPKGNDAQQYFKIVRGPAEMTVRAVLEVPASEGFTVGDITIDGQAIEFGGQIAEHITMKLTGLAFGKGQIQNPPQQCVAQNLAMKAKAMGMGRKHFS